eukprot:TRINITY_DN7307_c0_g1_i1.p2 TRINITY_DN7307_c0_g1~~TRINITY_DN7307_c0_g1_i1.p2  ORF type:complete len:101 (+),score=11.27 TRINITY_DN7307_c0_g1_i1:142-444(+)
MQEAESADRFDGRNVPTETLYEDCSLALPQRYSCRKHGAQKAASMQPSQGVPLHSSLAPQKPHWSSLKQGSASRQLLHGSQDRASEQQHCKETASAIASH